VDEWLRVNATCPTCRHSIFGPTEGSGTGVERETNGGEEKRGEAGRASRSIALVPYHTIR
jgi:hypothetical protein